MIDAIHENPLYRFLIACILALTLTFVHEIDLFSTKVMLGVVLIITILMVFGDIANDLPFVLLLIALLVMVFNLQISVTDTKRPS